MNGGGVLGRSPKRTALSHISRSSASEDRTPKEEATVISLTKLREAELTVVQCVTIWEIIESAIGFVAAANAFGSFVSAAFRFAL